MTKKLIRLASSFNPAVCTGLLAACLLCAYFGYVLFTSSQVLGDGLGLSRQVDDMRQQARDMLRNPLK